MFKLLEGTWCKREKKGGIWLVQQTYRLHECQKPTETKFLSHDLKLPPKWPLSLFSRLAAHPYLGLFWWIFETFLSFLSGSYSKKVNERWRNSVKVAGNSVPCNWWWTLRGANLCFWCREIKETVSVMDVWVWLLHCHKVLRVIVAVEVETRWWWRDITGYFIHWPIPRSDMAEHAHHVVAFGTCKLNKSKWLREPNNS